MSENKPELTPLSFVFQRAAQIQEHIIPRLRESAAEIEEQILIYETELKVLSVAAGAFPPDVASLSELTGEMPLEGGVN